MDTTPTLRRIFSMDVAFIALLWLIAFTGTLLLILRAAPMRGTLTMRPGGWQGIS